MRHQNQEFLLEGSSRKSTRASSLLTARREARSETPFSSAGFSSSKVSSERTISTENRLRRINTRNNAQKECLSIRLPGVEYIIEKTNANTHPLHEIEIQQVSNLQPPTENKPRIDSIKLDKLAIRPPKLDLFRVKNIIFDHQILTEDAKSVRDKTPTKLRSETPKFNTERIHFRTKNRVDEMKAKNEIIHRIHGTKSKCASRDGTPKKDKSPNRIFAAWSFERNKRLIDPRFSYRKLNEVSAANVVNVESAGHLRIPLIPKQSDFTPRSSYNGIFKVSKETIQNECSSSLKDLVTRVRSESRTRNASPLPCYLQLKQLKMEDSVNRLRKFSYGYINI
jgi:hypothetical protein